MLLLLLIRAMGLKFHKHATCRLQFADSSLSTDVLIGVYQLFALMEAACFPTGCYYLRKLFHFCIAQPISIFVSLLSFTNICRFRLFLLDSDGKYRVKIKFDEILLTILFSVCFGCG